MLTDAAFHLRMPNYFRVSEVDSVHAPVYDEAAWLTEEVFPKKWNFQDPPLIQVIQIFINVQNKPKSTNQKRHLPF